MRITQLTPGTGHFYCGNCLRDGMLAAALRRQGHDVTVAPLYLPIHADAPAPDRVFLGGITMYLQHRFGAARRLPRALTHLLDAPGLLRWASRRGDMTDAAAHADLTVSMLRGEDELQASELDELIEWIREEGRPDVVLLCNVLLVGLARTIRRELGVPVLTNLHGEDAFLDSLPEPRRSEAWAILRERVGELEGCIAVSQYYGDLMSERLGLPHDKLHIVHNGVTPRLSDPAPRAGGASGSPVVGYLARMCPEKGLDTLVDAFIGLHARGLTRARLEVAGVMLKPDRLFVRDLERRLEKAGCRSAVTFRPNLTEDAKEQFLQSLDVLSVPATYGEAFGLYVVEAMSHGIPVVQPRHAAFSEIIGYRGGGLLCDPDDPNSLADSIERVLRDRELADTLVEQGRQAVTDYFNDDRMATEVAAVCMKHHVASSARHGEASLGATGSSAPVQGAN